MVNDSGQLYTIEGISAGLLMIVTAYLVVSSTTVLTPQDVHITDVQLEQLGNDALAMMDTRNTYTDPRSPLQDYVFYDDSTNKSNFEQQFLLYCNSTPFGRMDDLRFNATIHYINNVNEQSSYTYYEPPGYDYYRENAVKVSRWIYLEDYPSVGSPDMDMDSGPQIVLMEVLLWRA
jgi:hypothetical protein